MACSRPGATSAARSCSCMGCACSSSSTSRSRGRSCRDTKRRNAPRGLEARVGATVSDFVLERLVQWGIRRVYGYPGDGINGVVLAFADRDDLEFIQVRHEE